MFLDTVNNCSWINHFGGSGFSGGPSSRKCPIHCEESPLSNGVFLFGNYYYFWLGACLWSGFIHVCLSHTQHEPLQSANNLFNVAQTAPDTRDADVWIMLIA